MIAAITLSVGITTFAKQWWEEGHWPRNHQEGKNRDEGRTYGTGGTGMQDIWNHFGKEFDDGDKRMFGPHEMKGKDHGLMSSGVRAAIDAKDYPAFVKAWNLSQATVLAPTKEAFAMQVVKYTLHQALEDAIVANNYEAYKKAVAAMESGDHKTPRLLTPEQFVKKVSMEKTHTAIETALLANNYEAFKTALAAMPKPGTGTDTRPTPPVPTATEFTLMVTHEKAQAALETTLKANDYPAFLVAWKANAPTVPTQEEFTKIIAKQGEIQKDKKERNGMIKNKGKGKKKK
jgi:hypothetical protein